MLSLILLDVFYPSWSFAEIELILVWFGEKSILRFVSFVCRVFF